MILAIRTDKPQAELYLYSDEKEKSSLRWHADRNLSKDIHKKIDELFSAEDISYGGLKGLVFYRGPGSFTGLRIGASIANTLSAELDIPIAGANGNDWIKEGLRLLSDHPQVRMVTPEYGSEPKTTKPKK